MARTKGQGSDDRKRVVSVLLDAQAAKLLDMAVAVLEVPPGEVLRRGLYLVTVTGEVLLGSGYAELGQRAVCTCE